jgi:hypothetical protein
MGNAHHPAKYLLAPGLNPTLHQPVWVSLSQSKSNSSAFFSNYVSPPRPVSALESGSYFMQKPAGQQIAAHTVTLLSVTKGKATLFQPPQRMLHALTPELWEDKRAASQSACLPPQTAQKLGREVSAHIVGTRPPSPVRPAPNLTKDCPIIHIEKNS